MGGSKNSGGPVERGFTGCAMPDGRLAHGPIATGTPTSVSIPVACPPGGEPQFLWHSHPGGVAYPSKQDIKSTREVGLRDLCITVPEQGETRCFRLRR